MIKMKVVEPTVKELMYIAKAYYPHSKQERKQHVRMSHYLYQNGRHAFQTGGWSRI